MARTIGATPRRSFLRSLALAPAAAAALGGCATTSGASTAKAKQGGAGSAEPTDALKAIRTFPLALEDEPALVFRALPVRPE